ncbi:MAG TPA: hypothetical protein VKT20_08045 [Candidatus Dormibacteraeota bacterium]|nr:hypothetical protein [Candidatus Dormibacteraeota bacterium]
MATRKRASSRSGLNRAVKAGRSALRTAERRLPPDVRKRIEKAIKDGQGRFDATVKDVRARVNKAAGQADVDRALKRLGELRKHVQTMVGNAAAAARTGRSAATSTARRATTRRTATRKAATRKTATRKTASRKTATRKTATRKTATRKAATRKTATRKPATRKAAPARSTPTRSTSTATARKPAARRTAPRRRTAPKPAVMPAPTIRYVPPAITEAPGPMPLHVETPES